VRSEEIQRLGSLEGLTEAVCDCRLCPRLVAWREEVARNKRASFSSDEYWGRAVPGFGDPAARLLVVGLAPAAHGANRTGRMFTGDRSGLWLFRALHRAGFASQSTAETRDDGLELRDAWITAAVRCAPPNNKPTVVERDTCRPFLEAELDLLDRVTTFVCLGGFAYNHLLRVLRERGEPVPRPKPGFGHSVEVQVGERVLICSFHPSQQNTFTGRLTEEMFDSVWARARELVGG
jgi:uracil-DNA glycosylase